MRRAKWHITGMSNIHAIIEKLETYCASTGLSPATVCNRATKNARLFDRLKNRAQQTEKDVLALEEYMRANPPKSEGQ